MQGLGQVIVYAWQRLTPQPDSEAHVEPGVGIWQGNEHCKYQLELFTGAPERHQHGQDPLPEAESRKTQAKVAQPASDIGLAVWSVATTKSYCSEDPDNTKLWYVEASCTALCGVQGRRPCPKHRALSPASGASQQAWLSRQAPAKTACACLAQTWCHPFSAKPARTCPTGPASAESSAALCSLRQLARLGLPPPSKCSRPLATDGRCWQQAPWRCADRQKAVLEVLADSQLLS